MSREEFCGLVKRGIHRTWELDDAGPYDLAFSKVSGKRPTFAEVSGKNHNPETRCS
jgi:hypothetical protein